MKLRKRAIGDLYLVASIIFIYLALLYFGFKGNGWVFLIIGIVIALLGVKTKKVMIEEEKKPGKARSKKKG